MLHLLNYVKYNESITQDNDDIEQILRIGQDEGYYCKRLTLSFSTNTIWLGNDSETIGQDDNQNYDVKIRFYQDMISRLQTVVNITSYQIFSKNLWADGLCVSAYGNNTDNLVEDINNSEELEAIRLHFDYYNN